MDWACAECGRTYHEPPETCACGRDTLVPTDSLDGHERPSGSALDRLAVRLHGAVFDPGSVDTGLASDRPAVALLFRLLVAVVAVLVVLVVVALLF